MAAWFEDRTGKKMPPAKWGGRPGAKSQHRVKTHAQGGETWNDSHHSHHQISNFYLRNCLSDGVNDANHSTFLLPERAS